MTKTFSTIVSDWQGVDEEPIAGSKNLIESSAVYNVNSKVLNGICDITTLGPSAITDNSYVDRDGNINSVSNFMIKKYPVTGNQYYTFSGRLSDGVSDSAIIVSWFDSNDTFIGFEPYGGKNASYKDKVIKSPSDAVFAYINVQKSLIDKFDFKHIGDIIASDNLQKESLLKSIYVNNLQYSEALTSTVDAGYKVDTGGVITSISSNSIYKYSIVGGNLYSITARYSSSYNIWAVNWFNTNGQYISQEQRIGTSTGVSRLDNLILQAPDSAAYLYLNIRTASASYTAVKEVTLGDFIYSKDLAERIDGLENTTDTIGSISLQTAADISNLTNSVPTSIAEGEFFAADGSSISNSNFNINKYAVIPGNEYCFSTNYTSSVNCTILAWADSNGDFMYSESYHSRDGQYTEKAIIAPEGAAFAWMNIQNKRKSSFIFSSIGESIKSRDLQAQIESLKPTDGGMKVVINTLEGVPEDTPFYIRTRYNADKDIILTHRVNVNTLITFRATYIGPNDLTDDELMDLEYLVSSHDDSTAALVYVGKYWHLFGQHGYLVPRINNTAGLTSEDKGALWKDQLDRQYNIGKADNNYVYLLPVIYQDANGHDVRDWESTGDSPSIESLTHVSGGTHTGSITVAGYTSVRLSPVMKHTNRKWYADNMQITNIGTYYCNEFKVSETQIGYDPATVQEWFGQDDKPVLTNAEPMVEYTYCFNYKGAQCCVNTTFNVLREVEFQRYGVIQQQFFYDDGDYKAMFMLPKAKAQNGVELDKPFNSPDSSARYYSFYRTSQYLKDVDDQIDRQIGFLYNPNTNDYKIGMAAGLSLVTGETVRIKRNINCPVGDSNAHYMINSLSTSNRNKFYIVAIGTANYADNQYYLPVGYFKELNAYVSYFDPAENVGQVYWYKDGNSYVIYAHCQEELHNQAINVPDFMEGLELSVVEKTSDTELLTETIQNGKFFVDYNSDEANYIVLKAR